ncbi:hypothetical protein DYBT9275_03122 [Dyadobacter sp. CECT 9275]|uniref:Uncharacterized protein n=1 Tax=Dyadobacter helix TaxID=2822344 RepID=A0A916JC33_9BACT|nr:hypothetical protein DYBT9275_03122 [Dyadobacter sp. CECT 9275]
MVNFTFLANEKLVSLRLKLLTRNFSTLYLT